MKKMSLLFLLSNIYFILFGQNNSQFVCPMKKGRIIVEDRGFNEGKRNFGATFEGKNSNVYSCSSGVVKAVDTSNGLITVYIEFEDYFFSYHNLEFVTITKSQAITKGENIGQIKKGERLFLITSKDKVTIDPQSILKCKIVNRNIRWD